MHKLILCASFAVCIAVSATADDIRLELLMPGTMFWPGSPFSVNLEIENTGYSLADAELFVALTLGTGDYWFYPSWAQYPPSIDWEEIYIPGDSVDRLVILPEFSWPYGAGVFDGAMFLAAVLDDDYLVSNLAEIYFGWSDDVSPTPSATPTFTPTPTADPTNTPVIPTHTSTPTATPTPDPTNTPPPPTHTPSPTPTGPTPTAPPGFVYVSPDTWNRGSPEDEPCRWGNEGPVHQVTLTRGYYVMTTEVTRQMWADLQAVQPTLPDDPSWTDTSPTMAHPVQRVTWREATLFANLLSVQDGLTQCYYTDAEFTTPIDETNYSSGRVFCDFDANGYRLPTEAEWEYAARAGTDGPFSMSEPNYNSGTCHTCEPDPSLNTLDSIAWWCGNSDTGSGHMTHPVGTKLANPWGLYDMHGNVAEWCWDWLGVYPSEPVVNPEGPEYGGPNRVVRGGNWSGLAQTSRSAFRGGGNPGARHSTRGFRLVRTAQYTD